MKNNTNKYLKLLCSYLLLMCSGVVFAGELEGYWVRDWDGDEVFHSFYPSLYEEWENTEDCRREILFFTKKKLVIDAPKMTCNYFGKSVDVSGFSPEYEYSILYEDNKSTVLKNEYVIKNLKWSSVMNIHWVHEDLFWAYDGASDRLQHTRSYFKRYRPPGKAELTK